MNQNTASFRMTMIRDCVRMASKNLLLNKKRSALTMLGVLIGVASIIALISLVTVATGEISDSFAALGTDTLIISAEGTGTKKGLEADDLEKLSGVFGVLDASPTVELITNANCNGAWLSNVSVVGKDEVFFRNNPGIVIAGRQMNPLDREQRSNICWISHLYTNELMGMMNPVGATVLIQGVPFVVAGVITPERYLSLANMVWDNTAFVIPYTTALKMNKTKYFGNVTLYLPRKMPHSLVSAEVEKVLAQCFPEDEESYHINDMKEYESSLNGLISMMSMLLIGTASISLLVGGIGIMNMMLTSVSERTTEIGLKKAIGAYAWVIQLQFLTESIILSMIGGACGIVIGFVLSFVVCRIMGVSFLISVSGIALGVGFSLIVGLIFGWAPAKTASKMNPIDALRSI